MAYIDAALAASLELPRERRVNEYIFFMSNVVT